MRQNVNTTKRQRIQAKKISDEKQLISLFFQPKKKHSNQRTSYITQNIILGKYGIKGSNYSDTIEKTKNDKVQNFYKNEQNKAYHKKYIKYPKVAQKNFRSYEEIKNLVRRRKSNIVKNFEDIIDQNDMYQLKDYNMDLGLSASAKLRRNSERNPRLTDSTRVSLKKVSSLDSFKDFLKSYKTLKIKMSKYRPIKSRSSRMSTSNKSVSILSTYSSRRFSKDSIQSNKSNNSFKWRRTIPEDAPELQESGSLLFAFYSPVDLSALYQPMGTAHFTRLTKTGTKPTNVEAQEKLIKSMPYRQTVSQPEPETETEIAVENRKLEPHDAEGLKRAKNLAQAKIDEIMTRVKIREMKPKKIKRDFLAEAKKNVWPSRQHDQTGKGIETRKRNRVNTVFPTRLDVIPLPSDMSQEKALVVRRYCIPKQKGTALKSKINENTTCSTCCLHLLAMKANYEKEKFLTSNLSEKKETWF